MSRDRASSINNINSKYGNTPKTSSIYPAAVPVIEVIPPVYAAESKIQTVRAVKYFEQQGASKSRIPKWIFVLVGIVILAGIAGGMYYFLNRQKHHHEESVEPIYGKPLGIKEGVTLCKKGFAQFKGRCVSCPTGSTWNGAACLVVKHKAKDFHPSELAEFIHRTYDPHVPLGAAHSYKHKAPSGKGSIFGSIF